MNVLPLVYRELRSAMRRPNSHRIRVAAGAIGMGVSCWALMTSRNLGSGGSLGLVLLQIIASVALVCALLAGAILTPDCLSQEKREGTLMLLWVTGLRPHEVVFGKLAAKLVIPFYTLLGLFPGFAICFVVGGVTGGECWRLLFVSLTTLFWSLSLGVLTSSLCREQRVAYGVALLLIFFGAMGAPLWQFLFPGSNHPSVLVHLGFLASPTGAFWLAFDRHYASAPGEFWSSLVMTNLVAWTSLWFACLLLRRDNSSEAEVCQAKPAKFAHVVHGADTYRRKDRRNKINDEKPIAWLVSRQRTGVVAIWSLAIAAFILWLNFDLNPLGNAKSQGSFLAWLAIQVVFKIWLAGAAAHAFAGDRRSGALESLLGTPLDVREVTTGMLQGFKRRFIFPTLLLCLVNALLAARLIAVGEKTGALFVAMLAAIFLIDCLTLCWVGLWRGLVAKHPAVATLATVSRIMILPWIWLGIVIGVFSKSSTEELAIAFAILTVVNSLIFWRGAKRSLYEHFRVMALRPYGEKPPYIESDLSAMNWGPDADIFRSDETRSSTS